MTYRREIAAMGKYLGLAASSTERAALALLLEVWQSAGGVQGGLVGRVGGLCRLDTGDVKATTSDGSLLGKLAQGTQGGGTESRHDVCDG
jgi:hypothetical protein